VTTLHSFKKQVERQSRPAASHDVAGLHVFLRDSVLGRSMRATAANPDLARAAGIDPGQVFRATWEDFLPILPFQIWAMLIVGGSGSNKGAVLGQRHAPNEFEKDIWKRFWELANDDKLAKEHGVRAIHGDAPYMRMEPERVYEVLLRSTGEVIITPGTPLPASRPML
jgi:hypothetical protein